MFGRPKPHETQEDLLHLQRQFMKDRSENKIESSATFISETKVEDEAALTANVEEQLANTFEAIPRDDIGEIIEKSNTNQMVVDSKFNTEKGFPRAKRRDVDFNPKSTRSIFAQQMKKQKIDVEITEKVNVSLPSQSYTVTGDEKSEIHCENVNRLKHMSHEEIMEERETLLANMDPAIVAFLKSKRNQATNQSPTIKQQNEAVKNIDIEEVDASNEILSQPDSNKWLNFDKVEVSKLAWMKDVDRPKIDRTKAFEARFDFDGWLLPFSEPVSEKSRILYHHGEEPERPGYTLQELFQLSRSQVIQQRIIALNTIANILSVQSTGVYDDVIDIPTEQIFFVLRFCLDDNTPTILNAAVKATRNLIYSQVDETCLDCLLGYGFGKIQPTLAVDHEDFDDRTNDQQLCETNLIKCLTRSGILIRIRYILNVVRPSTETIVYCIEILIRLVRDSEFILSQIYGCEGLVESVINFFVPPIVNASNSTTVYGTPLLQAVKFLRILSSRSKKIAVELVNENKIMDAILTYITSENYLLNTEGLRLQTESLHLWSVLIHYCICLQHFETVSPILLDMLNYHLRNTNQEIDMTFVRQSHIAALLHLIGTLAQHTKLSHTYINLLEQCTNKWLKQFMDLSNCCCGKLQLVSSLFYCLTALYRSEQISTNVSSLILDLIKSKGFENVTKTVENGSMLLNDFKVLKTSANIKSLESAAWDASEHVIPLLQSNSPLPFISALSNFVEAVNDNVIKLAFLQNINVANYTKALGRLSSYFLVTNWFTRVENNLIMNMLKICLAVKSGLDTSVFYELAVKCLSVFNVDQKPDIEFLLINIIFNPQFYPSDILLRHLDINQRTDSLETSLCNLHEIITVYSQVLGLRTDIPEFAQHLSLDASAGNVIPVDWIYTPIIMLYSNQQQKKNMDESDQIFIVKNCLRWVLIYETYFPELAATINATDRFCRLACVFLGSDSLFFVEEIHKLLEACLKNVSAKEEEINFSKKIQGLTSFQDFYTQLLEQYQGVSYGDVLFGNFILLPIAQRHSIKLRKTLWSEYSGVVEIFNVTPEQSICPIESFLTPVEEDMSLLKCYRRIIVNNSVRKHSILYEIAKHHVESYTGRKK